VALASMFDLGVSSIMAFMMYTVVIALLESFQMLLQILLQEMNASLDNFLCCANHLLIIGLDKPSA